jgi:hypothetical protein
MMHVKHVSDMAQLLLKAPMKNRILHVVRSTCYFDRDAPSGLATT